MSEPPRMMRVIPVVCTGNGAHYARCGQIELESVFGPIEALDILSGNWVMRVRVFGPDRDVERRHGPGAPHATYRFTCRQCPARNVQVRNDRLLGIIRGLALTGVRHVRALDISDGLKPLS